MPKKKGGKGRKKRPATSVEEKEDEKVSANGGGYDINWMQPMDYARRCQIPPGVDNEAVFAHFAEMLKEKKPGFVVKKIEEGQNPKVQATLGSWWGNLCCALCMHDYHTITLQLIPVKLKNQPAYKSVYLAWDNPSFPYSLTMIRNKFMKQFCEDFRKYMNGVAGNNS